MTGRQQTRIEKALKPLIGLPLTDMWHPVFQVFEFGEQRPARNRKGEDITRADYSLHVSCPWRIVGPDGLTISSSDYSGEGPRPRQGRSSRFFNAMEAATLTVERLCADDVASLFINMAGGYRLEILPMDTVGWHDYWRLLGPPPESVFFDVTTQGIHCHSASNPPKRRTHQQPIATPHAAD